MIWSEVQKWEVLAKHVHFMPLDCNEWAAAFANLPSVNTDCVLSPMKLLIKSYGKGVG